ncbi:hypothetical protein D5R93_01155 [Actinomyces lilanjuaniae]|uniref:Uncharacterized protein n=1 Tax=Actinomyces lilanjuaniae TaxID=2321394 RepID=A0ABN5PLB1_9ACTO|nr:hypothetical protein D5R93_01155 [Actinomyces lilanjuaniae]
MSADGADPDDAGVPSVAGEGVAGEGSEAARVSEAAEGSETGEKVGGAEESGVAVEASIVEAMATSCARSGVLAVREDSSACFLAWSPADRARAGGARTSW